MLKNIRLLQMAHNVDPVRPTRILKIKDVMKRAAIARSTIYDWLNTESPRYDPTFPIQRRLGAKSVGWLESELDDWLNNRPKSI